MTDAPGRSQREVSGLLPAAFRTPGSSSFSDFLGSHAPHLLPSGRPLPAGTHAGGTPGRAEALEVPHATTIVALAFDGGVVMAGDRRATMGNLIAHREIEKVFPADEYSCVGIAGTAGLAVAPAGALLLLTCHDGLLSRAPPVPARPPGRARGPPVPRS